MPKTNNWMRKITPNKTDPKRIFRILVIVH
jgi:hypothetical protein